jgi:2-dehydro-3-deoxygluconokinase
MGRLSTVNYEKLLNSKLLDINFGGAEANVSVTMANLGIEKSAFISVLPDNDLGNSVIRYLRYNNVETEHIVKTEGRLGLYFVETGFSQRNSTVIYDRKNSAMAEVNPEVFDFEEIFKGYSWFHVSGITPAVSEKALKLTKNAMAAAKKSGLKISLDLNYREKLWDFQKARDVLSELAGYADMCIGIEPLNLLGKDGKDIKNGLSRNEPSLEDMDRVFKEMEKTFGMEVIARTARKSISSNRNALKGFLYINGKTIETEWEEFDILDRVGGGDSFAAGLIYAVNHFEAPEQIIEFALACSILKHTIRGDAGTFTHEEVEKYLKEGMDIKR